MSLSRKMSAMDCRIALRLMPLLPSRFGLALISLMAVVLPILTFGALPTIISRLVNLNSLSRANSSLISKPLKRLTRAAYVTTKAAFAKLEYWN